MTGGFSEEALAEYQRLMSQQLDTNHDFTECVDVFDFRLCQRPNGTFYGTAGQCRLGVETTRNAVIKEIKSARGDVTPKQAKMLAALSDEDLGRVHRAVKESKLDLEQAQRVASAASALSGETQSGRKKIGGDNLQLPEEAAKYVKFYESGAHEKHQAPRDVSPAEVKAVLAELKESLSKSEYAAVMKALGDKGSPQKEMYKEAGWKNKTQRAEAVLKSLMDNDFKDVNGTFLSWRQGMQLDHKRAGSHGGTDTPDNWIWISAPTNQAKGAIENTVKNRVAAKKLSAKDAPQEIDRLLIKALKENAAMTPEEVAKRKEEGEAEEIAKKQRANAMRDNLPLMTPDQRAELINNTKGSKNLRALIKGSVTTKDGQGYAVVVTGGKNGARMRNAYPNANAIKALAKARWGLPLTSDDLKDLATIADKSTGSTLSNRQIFESVFERFKPETPLTEQQMDEILSYVTRKG